MKVLTPLTVLWLLSSALVAQENNSFESYISELKNKQYNLEYKKNEVRSSILRDSWINSLNLNYTYSKSNPYESVQINESAAIRVDQPIFQSGGIYFGIKYATASRVYGKYSVDVAKRKMIKDAIALLMQIQQTTLQESRQKLLISNAEIDLQRKQEQYLSGQLDSGFLDRAIIEKNTLTQLLYDVETKKERLLSSFSAISDLSYKDAKIPHLELLDKEKFLTNNIVLEMAESKIEVDRYNKNVTISKYLPGINFVGGYNWIKNENRAIPLGAKERDYYDYGLRVSFPLSINSVRVLESSKVDFIKSQLAKEDKVISMKLVYDEVLQNIENLKKKMKLSADNEKLRSKLLRDTKKLFNAGYKTQYDIDTLQNSVEIAELDSKIYELDRQQELLKLYETYINSGK